MTVVFGNVLNRFSVLPIDMDAVDIVALDYFVIAIGLLCILVQCAATDEGAA